MRLIDADKVQEILSKTHTPTWIAVKGIIASMPTVDAVPVVRCKDCIDRSDRPDPFMEGKIQCKISGAWHPMDGYCQSGVKKKNHDDDIALEEIKAALVKASEICKTHCCANCQLRYIDKESGFPMCPFSDDDCTFPPMNWRVGQYEKKENAYDS